jgi:hypothetical protein
MDEAANRLFVGIKITRAIQEDLDNPAPDVKQYFDANNDYLQIVEFGAAKFIGRYLNDGFRPAVIISLLLSSIASR